MLKTNFLVDAAVAFGSLLVLCAFILMLSSPAYGNPELPGGSKCSNGDSGVTCAADLTCPKDQIEEECDNDPACVCKSTTQGCACRE